MTRYYWSHFCAREGQIVSGLKRPARLKRPANGKLIASPGIAQQVDEGPTALRLAVVSVAAAAVALRKLAGWAAGRSISPNSLTGISLLLALCAAAWFSGGPGADSDRGLIAMGGWLLAMGAAWRLAVGDVPAGADPGNAAEPDGAAAAGARGFGWLSGVCAVAAECAIYGGMAAGGRSTGLIGVWPLAVMTVSSVAVAELLGGCRAAAVTCGRCREIGWSPAARQWTRRLLCVPPAVRALLAAAGFAAAGPQAALFAVLAVEVIAIAWTIALVGQIAPAATGVGGDAEALGPGGSAEATGIARTAMTTGTPGGQVASGQDVVLALRDDGSAARWAGRLVQGYLIPLPPALAGLIATAMLAALGLRHLPGFVAMTPPVVMMLAAPGSSHPHDGRFDWLVPVLLALAQYVYLGALGFALAVPGPVIFSACALTFLWYTSITGTTGAGPGSGIGWETRLFVVGLAATFGLAAFGYLGLATYLGVFISRKVMIGYLVPREEDRW